MSMTNLYGLSTNQMRLLSSNRRGLEKINLNRSQEYLAIERRAHKALSFLTLLAGYDYRELPQDRYERTLTEKQIVDFIGQVIVGRNTSREKKFDLYGTRLAAECARICLEKLDNEYRKATESQLSEEQNLRIVNGGGTGMLYVEDFGKEVVRLNQLSDIILDEVQAACAISRPVIAATRRKKP